MAKNDSLSKVKLSSFDDLFQTDESREDTKRERLMEIPIVKICDFPDHPYKVKDDESMDELVESIKKRGLIKEQSRYSSIIQKEKDSIITKCSVIDNEYKSRLNSEDAVFLSKTRSLQQKKQLLISDRKISNIEKTLTAAFYDLGGDNSGWIKYTPSQSIPSDLLVGTIAVPSGISSPNEIQTEVLKKIPCYNVKVNCFVIPFSVSTGKPFLIYSETDQSNVLYQAEIFNSFVLRQLRFMPKKSINTDEPTDSES